LRHPPNQYQLNLSTRITSSKPQRKQSYSHFVFKFYDKVKVLYDQASVSKSSITVDTAFQKDLTLQGCTTLPTRVDRLLAPYVTHFPWCAGRGWSTKTFLLLRLNHEFTKRGKLCRNGARPEVGPSNCAQGLVYQRLHHKQPWPHSNQSLNTQIR
jgi:hypothetical protein